MIMENKELHEDAASSELPSQNGTADLYKLVSADTTVDTSADDAYKKKSSLWVMYLTMMFTMISIAIEISSTWPYLQKIEPKVSPNFLGWANFGFNAGAIVGDLAFGKWMNSRPSREPILASLIIMILSGLLYAYAQSMGRYNGMIAVFICRVLLGLTRGNMTCTRSVVSEVTTISERSAAMANLVIGMTFGFSLGSAIQAAMVQIGEKGLYISALRMHLNLYTIPAYLIVLFGIINIIIVLRFIKPTPKQQKIELSKVEAEKSTKSKILACVCLVFMFSLVNFGLSLMETLLVPFVQHQFALTRGKAIFMASMVFTGQGLVGLAHIIATKYLSRRFKDRSLLAVFFSLVTLCFFLYIPMGNTPLKVTAYSPFNQTINGSRKPALEDVPVGCPIEYSWCRSSPQVSMAKFFIGAIVFAMGYSCCLGLIISLFTKMLGNKRQGTSVGLISAFGNVGRLTAPITGSESYVNIGPGHTFTWVLLLCVSALCCFVANFKNLDPTKKTRDSKEDRGEILLKEDQNYDKDGFAMYVTPL